MNESVLIVRAVFVKVSLCTDMNSGIQISKAELYVRQHQIC